MKPKRRQTFVTPLGGEQTSFDLEVKALLDEERALIQRSFGVVPQFDALTQIWRITLTAGDPTNAPEGLFTVCIDVPRAGHWVEIGRVVDWRGSHTLERIVFATDLPNASFAEALDVVYTVLMELAKGKEPTA